MNADAGEDIGRKLFFAFAKAELPILMQKEEEVSLEDVFIELTQKEEKR